MSFCEQCGNKLGPNDKFCATCGHAAPRDNAFPPAAPPPPAQDRPFGVAQDRPPVFKVEPAQDSRPPVTGAASGAKPGGPSAAGKIIRIMAILAVAVVSLVIFVVVVSHIVLRGEGRRPGSGSTVMTEVSWYAQTMAMATSFKNLAGMDFNALLDMSATPEARKAWQEASGGLFASQIDAAAFFDTAFVMVPECSARSFTVIAYNMWIDSAVLARYEKSGNEFSIRELKALSAGNPDVVRENTPAGLTNKLTQRLRGAAATDYSALAFSKDNSRATAKALSDYRVLLRENFSPDGPKDNQPLRKAVEDLLELCRKPESGTAKADAGTVAGLPYEWRAMLHPVYVSKQGARNLVVLAASNKPGRWLFADMELGWRSVAVKGLSIGSVSPESRGVTQ